MFSSSGYFKGVNCPYYSSGLCERAYCHFRHVKHDIQAQPKQATVGTGLISTNKDESPKCDVGESAVKNGLGQTSSLLSMMGSAIKQVQRDIEKDKAQIHHLRVESGISAHLISNAVPNYRPTPIGQIKPRPLAQKKPAAQNKVTYIPPPVPAYKPTPIHLLQKQKQPIDPLETEHGSLSICGSPNATGPERITLGDAEQKSSAKTPIDFVVTKNIKIEQQSTSENEIEAKFSSDEGSDAEEVSDNGFGEQNNKPGAKTLTYNKSSDLKQINTDAKDPLRSSVSIHTVTIKKEKIDPGYKDDLENDKNSVADDGQKNIKKEPGIEEVKKIVPVKIKEEKENEQSVPIKDNNGKTTIDTAKIDKYDHEERPDVAESNDKENNKNKCTEVSLSKDTENNSETVHEMSKSGDKDKTDKENKNKNNNRGFVDDENKHEYSNLQNRDKSLPSKQRSDKSKHKHRQHSHSPAKKPRQSSSSKHRKDERKHKESSHRSRKEHHRSKDRSKKNKHKKSEKSHSKRNSKTRHKDSKHKKSDKHKHHSRHSSKSSKRKHRHSSVTSDSSLSSSSSSRSSFMLSSSSSSQSSSPSPHSVTFRKNSSDSKSSHTKSRTDSRSPRSSTSQSDLKKYIGSSVKSLDNQKKPTCISEKPNLFETFRTISHIDLFGEDSDDNDISKSAKEAQSLTSEVILLSDDSLSGDDDNCLLDDHSDGASPGTKRKHEGQDEGQENAFKIPRMVSTSCTHGEQSLMPTKKRVAHPSNPDAMIKRPTPGRGPAGPSASQMMLNRYKTLQKKQEELELLSESSETPTTALTPSDCSSSGKRMAHIPRVSISKPGHTLMKKRCGGQKMKMTEKTNTNMEGEETLAGTVPKGGTRSAHMPSQKVLRQPLIPTESGGKVATNIRQRYLNIFVDECLKMYPQRRDAHDRALMEEKNVYDRASNKNIYLNIAVNMIKKFRDEITRSSDGSDQETRSPTKNPKALSHTAVLGGSKAAKTRFTMNRTGRVKVPEHLTSRQLFVLISRYIMTEEQLVENCFPRPSPGEPGHALIQLPERVKRLKISANLTEKACARCGKRFTVLQDGTYARKENCEYHWGKCWKRRIAGSIENRYTCCQGDLESKGCQISEYHAHEQNKYQDLTGYAQTVPCSPPPDGNYKLYAMDCEMVYTSGGCELARVTVIDTDLQSVYEAIVLPEYEIVDYNTRFSGLTAADMKGVTTTLQDVQDELLSMFSDTTILIGHSLESDLTALKLLHNTVVDTSVVFPHKLGPPYKRALRTLMAEILQKIIQNNDDGHDSKEDAVSCMELMIYKAKDDAKKAMRS